MVMFPVMNGYFDPEWQLLGDVFYGLGETSM
jgi:hypothetical protein